MAWLFLDTEGDDKDKDNGDEDIDWSLNCRQVARGSSQANPVVIKDNETDLDLEAKGDKAGDKASSCAEPLELGDGNDSFDEELPSFKGILKPRTVHDNVKLPVLGGNQTDNPKKVGAAISSQSRETLGIYVAAD